MTELNPNQREDLINLLAYRYLDGMSSRDLERFFIDMQLDAFSSYSDEELLGEVEDNFYDEEYQEIMTNIANGNN